MKVFVTGGTGYIGSAVCLRLKKAGHDVQALVRDKAKGAQLQSPGVKLVEGDLANPAGYAAAAYGVQAFVHCAQDHGPKSVELDRKTILNARELLHGKVGATFIYTSGIWVLGDTAGVSFDESHSTNPIKLVAWRSSSRSRWRRKAFVPWSCGRESSTARAAGFPRHSSAPR